MAENLEISGDEKETETENATADSESFARLNAGAQKRTPEYTTLEITAINENILQASKGFLLNFRNRKIFAIYPVLYDACKAARFSMFISESLVMYPCSFMKSSVEGIVRVDTP